MTAVDVRNLSKIYRIYTSSTHRLKEMILRRPFHTDFVALDNISFSVFRGETFGIIGENGAGKSTLLKILARTLKPTNGAVTVNGRTAALLELGAGFNPELTGEENIYLNAYLMGLSKADISEKKQEIVDFSELGNFIKRPVKTYSSGMYVRLAFSIATSVNPDILIVDEALAVGDEYFQKKCIDRMVTFKKSGKTILFCSHNMYYVQELCQRTIWLNSGHIRSAGETGKVIMEYQGYERDKMAALKEKVTDIVNKSDNAAAGKPVTVSDVKIMNGNGIETETLRTFGPALFSFRVHCIKDNLKGHVGFAIIRNDEVMSFGTLTNFDGLPPINFRDGQEFKIMMKSLPLLTGMYSLLIVIADEFALHPYDSHRTHNFSVEPSRRELGISYMEHEWIL